ncbi:major facilitator superfamily domain-containing protein, partial [Coniochaeta sp. 2T2.1]
MSRFSSCTALLLDLREPNQNLGMHKEQLKVNMQDTIQEAFDELHVEHIPGTEVMRDVGKIHLVHGPKSHEVLIPVPSDDPRDPLNWSPLWKWIAISVQAIYCFVAVASALSVAPMIPLLEAEFGLSPTQLNLLTGVCVLALGYANFFIVPLSNIFGRRFASISMGLLCVGSSIWVALAKSYGSLLGARILNGFATATSETLMVQVIADLFFLHERGRWMGVYFTMYFFGLFIGPIVAGNIAAVHGWRSFFWLSLALSVFCLLTLVFLFPETKFHRADPAVVSAVPSAPELEEKASQTHKEEEPRAEQPVPELPIGKGRPSKSQFGLLCKPDPKWKSFIIRDIVTPLQVFLYPIIFWAGLCVGGPANTLLLWNLTESSVLSAPPYNFSVSAVGYANFAFL